MNWKVFCWICLWQTAIPALSQPAQYTLRLRCEADTLRATGDMSVPKGKKVVFVADSLTCCKPESLVVVLRRNGQSSALHYKNANEREVFMSANDVALSFECENKKGSARVKSGQVNDTNPGIGGTPPNNGNEQAEKPTKAKDAEPVRGNTLQEAIQLGAWWKQIRQKGDNDARKKAKDLLDSYGISGTVFDEITYYDFCIKF